MLLIKICAVYYIFLNIVAEIHTLEPLLIVKNNNIAATEIAIRNTVNNLFRAFNIQGIRSKPKIRQFSTIHNFFVSITLLDGNSLEEIARLTRVKTIDNNTRNFIAQINEVLNGDDKDNEENDKNIYITTYIQKFIKELKRLKEIFLPKRDNVINTEILKYIDSDRNTPANLTEDNFRKESENENILDNSDFWQRSGRRIYQGTRTKIKRFPFVASVHIFDRFTCAGTIIKMDLVITSSSCLQIAWNNRFFRENPAFLSVRVGCDYYDFCGDSIAVLEIYFHPRYSPKNLRNNLAIMRLSRKISFHHSQGRVKKIMIDRNPWPLPANTGITLIGWGARDVTNVVHNGYKNRLSYADLDFFPLNDCQEHYSKEFVTSDNFCAGFLSVGGGACNHDAGGPGIADSTLMGVISFGSPECGAADAPTVFTKLGFYTDWIDEIMEQDIKNIRGRTTERPFSTPIGTPFLYLPKTKRFVMRPLEDTTTTIVPLDDAEILRLPRKQNFEEFLSTVFSSEEIATYVDESDTETKEEINTDQNNNINDDDRLGESTTKSQMKTVIEKAGDVVDDDDDDDDDKGIEEDIISLIESLNLDQMLISKTKLLITDNIGTVTENINSQKKMITHLNNVIASNSNQVKKQVKETASMKKVTASVKPNLQKIVSWFNYLTTSNKVDNQDQEATTNVINHQISKITTLKPVSDSFKVESHEGKDLDSSTSDDTTEYDDNKEGLSIPVKTFIDLTLRDRAADINKIGSLSEAAMFDLISVAIEEQAKQLNINKPNPYLL